jgi:type IV secretory pathway TrbD component
MPAWLSGRIAVGLVALGLLLLAEFTVVLWLRGLTTTEYLTSRDPIAGTTYLVMLGVFAIMPLLVTRRSDRDPL